MQMYLRSSYRNYIESDETYYDRDLREHVSLWYEFTCERCSRTERFSNTDKSERSNLWFGNAYECVGTYAREVFKKTQKGLRTQEVFSQTYCPECQKNVVAHYVHTFMDIALLNHVVNKLYGVINEKRKQASKDNRPTSHDACQCGEGCAQWRAGYREGYRAAQAGEEHHRVALLGDEDRDV